MGYLEERLLEAMNKEKVVGKEGINYGKWSPNNVRGIHIFLRCIVIEKHVGPPSVVNIDPAKAHKDVVDISKNSRRQIDPVTSVLRRKMFKNIEEITLEGVYFAPQGNLLFPQIVSNLQSVLTPRFRRLALSQSDPNVVLTRAAVQSIRETNQEALLTQLLSGFRVKSLVPENMNYLSSIGLSPSVYPLDVSGGELEQALEARSSEIVTQKKVAKTHEALIETDNQDSFRLKNTAIILEEALKTLQSTQHFQGNLKEALGIFKKGCFGILPTFLSLRGVTGPYADPRFVSVFNSVIIPNMVPIQDLNSPEKVGEYLSLYKEPTKEGYLNNPRFKRAVSVLVKASERVRIFNHAYDQVTKVNWVDDTPLGRFCQSIQDIVSNDLANIQDIADLCEEISPFKPAEVSRLSYAEDVLKESRGIEKQFDTALRKLVSYANKQTAKEAKGSSEDSLTRDSKGRPLVAGFLYPPYLNEILRFIKDSERKAGKGGVDATRHEILFALLKAPYGVEELKLAVEELEIPEGYIELLSRCGYFSESNVVTFSEAQEKSKRFVLLNPMWFCQIIIEDNRSKITPAMKEGVEQGDFSSLLSLARKVYGLDV